MKNVVLIVEDNQRVREAMCRALSDDSFDVQAVPDGTAALNFLTTHLDVELVVLDLRLPDVSGWEVLAKLRSHAYLKRVPVIIVSGLAAPPQGLEAEAYLQKPFRPEALARMARSLVPRDRKSGGSGKG